MNLLGKVAGRVGGVAGRVGGAVFGEAKAALTAPVASDEAEVETLLQNISDGMMPEFRRDAMTGLKELLTDNPKAQLAFGHMGIPILVNVLCDDRDDLELLRGALETLVIAMSSEEDSHAVEPPPGAINSELFARQPKNVSLLLAYLEDEPVGSNDFYVRYYTVQLLTALLQSCSFKLQEAILASPMGVVRLMDMLMEREVIRNEALQLLVVLTKRNEEVQKIAAFEGAFERIFNIVREEGASDGGVVVQDCLTLLNNLLRGNDANQRLFREMGYVSNLTQLLKSAVQEAPPAVQGQDSSQTQMPAAGTRPGSMTELQRYFGGGPATVTPLPRQKAAILLCALEAAMLMVAAPSSMLAEEQKAMELSNRSSNQTKLLQVGLFSVLISLCLTDGGVPSVSVRSQAFHCIADLVADHQGGQEAVLSASVRSRVGEMPVLQSTLLVALYGQEATERRAAESLIASFCRNNPMGQAALADSIAPLPKPPGGHRRTGSFGSAPPPPPMMLPGQPPPTFGTDLVAALTAPPTMGSSSVQLSCRASSVMQHLLLGNEHTKLRMLSQPIELSVSPHSPPETLMPRVMRFLSDALRVGDQGKLAAAQQLRLLIVWLSDCSPVVAALLEGAPNLPLLVDLINGRMGGGDAILSGLAALVLGVCLVHGQPSSQGGAATAHSRGGITNPSDTVMSVLLSRVGLTQYFHKLEDLRKSPLFVQAANTPVLPNPITRASVAAATAMDHRGAGEEEKSDVFRGGRDAPSSVEDSPFDLPFTLFVEEVEAGVRAHSLKCFTQPARRGSQGGSGGGGVSHKPALAGTTDSERLQHAEDLIRQLEDDVAELRNRNRALIEDAFSGGAQPSGGSVGGGTTGGAGGGEAARSSQPTQHTLGGPPPSAADVEARVAAELRASRAEREATSLRQQVEMLRSRLAAAEHAASEASAQASQATSAAHKHEQDLKELSSAYNAIESHSFHLEAQLRELQGKMGMSQQTSTNATESMHKMQAELEAAKSARAHAEHASAHATQQLQALHAELAAAKAAQAAAETRAASAGAGASAGGVDGISEAQVARRVEAAVAKAKAEAEAEGEEQLTDLLVCLGQEETKVAALSEKLRGYGVDVDAMIEAVMAEAEGEGEGDVL